MVRQKYVFNKHGTYHYQRDYPTKLKHLIQKKTFTYPLQLKVTEASELEIQKAALRAEEAYQRQLLLISNSDPDAMSATDLEKAAADFLRKRGLVAGQFVKVAKDNDISVKEEQDQRQLQADGYDFADWAVPEFEDVLHKYQAGQPLTLQDKIVGEARNKLVNKAKAKPKTLGSLWVVLGSQSEIGGAYLVIAGISIAVIGLVQWAFIKVFVGIAEDIKAIREKV